jgi:hypothetical protein
MVHSGRGQPVEDPVPRNINLAESCAAVVVATAVTGTVREVAANEDDDEEDPSQLVRCSGSGWVEDHDDAYERLWSSSSSK